MLSKQEMIKVGSYVKLNKPIKVNKQEFMAGHVFIVYDVNGDCYDLKDDKGRMLKSVSMDAVIFVV